MRHVMRDGGYLLALAVLSACNIPDLTFGKPVAGQSPPGAIDASTGSPSPGPGDASSLPPSDSREKQSCEHLPAKCGPNKDENCCMSLLVRHDTYKRGYDIGSDNMFSNQMFSATVSDFRLDKFEVTVGRFRAFYNAEKGIKTSPPRDGTGAHPNSQNTSWNPNWDSQLPATQHALDDDLHCSTGQGDLGGGTWYVPQDGDPSPPDADVAEQRPINCISWYEAMAFCIWDGGYLPTEAEWGLAATTSQQRPYPWSNVTSNPLQIDGSLVVGSFNPSPPSAGDDWCKSDPGQDPTCNLLDLPTVGSRLAGAGMYGQLDLAGSLGEWMFDAAGDSGAPTRIRNCTDCAQSEDADHPFRINRGGSTSGGPAKQRTGLLFSDAPDHRSRILGFRCARNP